MRPPLTRTERAIKRAMDIVVASLGLIALSPIFVLTSIAILIESGRPVLFRLVHRPLVAMVGHTDHAEDRA